MTDRGSSDTKPVNAIDIFVFSNGEQNAPPRKYHLELKEIYMWKGTLRNLGNSHYGIKNVDIDIYTTDGRKVEGPSELNHQKAYVAVIPPCAFIQAGYDNYLIKASRSWEKRLVKITNSIESSTKDSKRRVLTKPEINIKIIENENQNRNDVEVDMKAKIGSKANDIVSTDTTKDNKLQECSKAAKCIGNKQIKKPSFANETTTLKTQIFTPFKISSAGRRSVMKAKETLQIKPTIPRKGFPINIKRNPPRTPCASNECNKLVGKNIKHSIITSLNVLAKKSENKFPLTTPPPNLKQTQDFEAKSLISNEETNIYKNNETEIISIPEVKRDETLYDRFKNTLENELVSISEKSGPSSIVRVKQTSSKLSLVNENKKHIHCIETYPMEKAPQAVQQSFTNCNCIPRQGPIDNFVAIVNNEKVFKLQLSLEIENGEASTKNNEADKKQSIKSILKEEKEIQVNMYEESNAVHEYNHEQLPRCDIIKNFSGEGKIIIIHCACFNDFDLNYLLQSHMSHNQMSQYEIIPELSPGTENTAENVRESKIQPPSVDPNKILAVNESADGRTEIEVSEQRVTMSGSEYFKCTATVDSETMRPREISTYSNPEDHKLDIFISRSTQTNWCSIILQAVRHEDGRYSLHLPPLLTVKNMADCCE